MNDKVNVKLLFFAKSRELAGINECNLEIKRQIICSNLLNEICNSYQLNDIKCNLILAINGDYCDDPSALLNLKEGDEIAVIPPLSGG